MRGKNPQLCSFTGIACPFWVITHLFSKINLVYGVLISSFALVNNNDQTVLILGVDVYGDTSPQCPL